MRLNIVIAILLFGLQRSGTQIATAQTMWERRSTERVFLTRDLAARNVGDLLTVLIRETTDVANRDKRAMGKDSNANFNFNVASAGDAGSTAGSFNIAGDSDRSFNGSSQFSAAHDFTDRITVQVIDVLPNGNMVIAGRRRRQVAGEVRILNVSGIVRERDVAPNNTVRSQYIANFKVGYDGEGPESSFANQGWAGRIMNKIWPF